MADKRPSRRDKTGTVGGDKANARGEQNGRKTSRLDPSWSSSTSSSFSRPKSVSSSPPPQPNRKNAERRSRLNGSQHKSNIMPTVEEKNEQPVTPETDADHDSMPALGAVSSQGGLNPSSSVVAKPSSSRTSRIPMLTTSRDSVHELKSRDNSKTNVAIAKSPSVSSKSSRRKSTSSDLASKKGPANPKDKDRSTKFPPTTKPPRSRSSTPETSRSSLRTSHSRCTDGYSTSTVPQTPGRRDSVTSGKESPSPTRKTSLASSSPSRKPSKGPKSPSPSEIKTSLLEKRKDREKTPPKTGRLEKAASSKSTPRASEKKRESSAALIETKPKTEKKTHGTQSPKKFSEVPSSTDGTIVLLEVDNKPVVPVTTSANVGTEDRKQENKICGTTSSLKDELASKRGTDKQNVSLSHSFLEMRRAADDAFYNDTIKSPTQTSGSHRKPNSDSEKYPQRPKSQPDILESLNLPDGIKSMPPVSMRPIHSPPKVEREETTPKADMPHSTTKDEAPNRTTTHDVGSGRKMFHSPFKPITSPTKDEERHTFHPTEVEFYTDGKIEPPIEIRSGADKPGYASSDKWPLENLHPCKSPTEKATRRKSPVQERSSRSKSPQQLKTTKAVSPVHETPRAKSPVQDSAGRERQHLLDTHPQTTPFDSWPPDQYYQRNRSPHLESSTAFDDSLTQEISSIPTSSLEKCNYRYPVETSPNELRNKFPEKLPEYRSHKHKGDKNAAAFHAQVPSTSPDRVARIVRVRDSGTQTRELKWAVSENTLLEASSIVKSEEPTLNNLPNSPVESTIETKNVAADSKCSVVGMEKVDVALALERGLLHLLSRVHELVEGYIQEQLAAATLTNSPSSTTKQTVVMNTTSAATQATSALPSGSSAPSSFQMVTTPMTPIAKTPPPTNTLADIAKAANDAATKLANLMLAAAGLGPEPERPKTPKTGSLPSAPSVSVKDAEKPKKESEPMPTAWEEATQANRIHDKYVVQAQPSLPQKEEPKKRELTPRESTPRKPVTTNRFKAGLNLNYSHYAPKQCCCTCHAGNNERVPLSDILLDSKLLPSADEAIQTRNVIIQPAAQPSSADEAIQTQNVIIQPVFQSDASMNCSYLVHEANGNSNLRMPPDSETDLCFNYTYESGIKQGVYLSDKKQDKAGMAYPSHSAAPYGHTSTARNRTVFPLDACFPDKRSCVTNGNTDNQTASSFDKLLSRWDANHANHETSHVQDTSSTAFINMDNTSAQIPDSALRRSPFLVLSQDSDSSVDAIDLIDRFIHKEHIMKPPSPTNLRESPGHESFMALPPAPVSNDELMEISLWENRNANSQNSESRNSDYRNCESLNSKGMTNGRLESGKQDFEEQLGSNEVPESALSEEKRSPSAIDHSVTLSNNGNQLAIAASQGEPITPVNVGDVEKISRTAVSQALYEIYEFEKGYVEMMPLTRVNMDVLTSLQSFGVSSRGDIQMDAELKIRNGVSEDSLRDQESSQSRQNLRSLEMSPSMASLLNKHNFRTNGPLIIVTAEALEDGSTDIVTSAESVSESDHVACDEESSVTDEENITEISDKEVALPCPNSKEESRGPLIFRKNVTGTTDAMLEEARNENKGASFILPTEDTDMVEYIDYVLEIANVVLTESQLSAIRRQSQSTRLLNLWNDFRLGSIPEEPTEGEMEDTFLTALSEKLTSDDDELHSTCHLSILCGNPDRKDLSDAEMFDTLDLSIKELKEDGTFYQQVDSGI